MEDPAFRYYIERKVAGRSSEPNLHILPTQAYEKWLKGSQQDFLSPFAKTISAYSNEVSGLSVSDKQKQGGNVLDKPLAQASAQPATSSGVARGVPNFLTSDVKMHSYLLVLHCMM